jgi:hypothetical protein
LSRKKSPVGLREGEWVKCGESRTRDLMERAPPPTARFFFFLFVIVIVSQSCQTLHTEWWPAARPARPQAAADGAPGGQKDALLPAAESRGAAPAPGKLARLRTPARRASCWPLATTARWSTTRCWTRSACSSRDNLCRLPCILEIVLEYVHGKTLVTFLNSNSKFTTTESTYTCTAEGMLARLAEEIHAPDHAAQGTGGQ